jgi:hypothetical protein
MHRLYPFNVLLYSLTNCAIGWFPLSLSQSIPTTMAGVWLDKFRKFLSNIFYIYIDISQQGDSTETV